MQALTRDQKLKSQKELDNSLGLITTEFKTLEAWVLESPQKQQEDLTKHLREDLSEPEVKWATEEKIEVMSTLQKSWEKKLLYISNLLGKLEEEVVNAPVSTAQDEEDTYETRQFNLRAQDKVYDETQQISVQ